MLVLVHFDWIGTAEELKEADDAWKKACAETDGIEYKGRYSPLERKFHWTYMHELEDEDYGKLKEARAKFDFARADPKNRPNAAVSLFSGPYHE